MSMRRSVSMNDTSRRRRAMRQSDTGRMSLADLSTGLVKAIRYSDEAWMTALLAAGAPPNARDDLGRPALCLLLETSGSPDACKALLEKGAQPDLPATGSGLTALHVASKKGYQVCVGQLLSAGANPDPVDASGNSPLMYACANGHHTSARTLIKAGASTTRVNQKGETGLHLAAKHGCCVCIKELLAANCPVNVTDGRGLTPLVAAAINKQTDVIQLLLEHSCNVNDQDPSTGRTPLHWAVLHQDAQTVKALIEHRADLDLRDVDWNTPFLIATNLRDRQTAQLLVEAGCDVRVTDKSFNTALHLTSRDGYDDLISIFFKSGLNLDIRGHGGTTGLMLGAFGGHERVVAELLSLGANPNVLDRNRASALTYALLSNASEDRVINTVKRLIQFNADLEEGANLVGMSRGVSLPPEFPAVSALEDRLYSPIEVAFLRENSSLCVMLMRAGCDLTPLRQLGSSKVNGRRTTNKDLLLKLLLCAKKQRKKIPTLKELCRRPSLDLIAQFTSLTNLEKLRLPQDLVHFLRYDDLLADLSPRPKPSIISGSDFSRASSSSHSGRNHAEPAPVSPGTSLGTPVRANHHDVITLRRLPKTPSERTEQRRTTTTEVLTNGTGSKDNRDQRRRLPSAPNSNNKNRLSTPQAIRSASQTRPAVMSVHSSPGCITPRVAFSKEPSFRRTASQTNCNSDQTPGGLGKSRVLSKTTSNLSRPAFTKTTPQNGTMGQAKAGSSRVSTASCLYRSVPGPKPDATPSLRSRSIRSASSAMTLRCSAAQ